MKFRLFYIVFAHCLGTLQFGYHLVSKHINHDRC